MTAKVLRCAVYTRKSSDEGLEQSFNSLDAQREAAEAYITSQASEGWRVIPTPYDDGGYSGGTMERPALQRLLADIAAGLVDIVVIYKIDRLTRSLADFARIVEVLEKAGCSFVSVTQSFNTTTSMGRLMLNVLLSFAQFEREVTGERIRDKIAASKARGMWMGGVPPLGYDLPINDTRVLQVNAAEAETVRLLFQRYLELDSVHALQRELVSCGIRSKAWLSSKGRAMGGRPFSRGALFHLLRNRVYLGQIVHKDLVHPGEHPPIVSEALFDKVQAHLDTNRRRTSEAKRTNPRAMLAGRLFDQAGEPMSPTISRGRSGRPYRYYVSASLQQGRKQSSLPVIHRLPAQSLERLLSNALSRWLPDEIEPLQKLASVRVTTYGLAIELHAVRPGVLAHRLAPSEEMVHHEAGTCTLHLPVALPLRGGRRVIVASSTRARQTDPTLIAALRRANAMLSNERGRPILAAAPVSPYERRLLRLAFLAPDIQRAILTGLQPPQLNLEAIMAMEIPLAWSSQRLKLGFA